MKLEKLEHVALRAQEELKAAEAKVSLLAKGANEAKGQARTAKQAYKGARRLARAARKLCVQAEAQLQEHRLRLIKAQKHSAKALKLAATKEATLMPVLVPGAVTANRPAGARISGRQQGKRRVARGWLRMVFSFGYGRSLKRMRERGDGALRPGR